MHVDCLAAFPSKPLVTHCGAGHQELRHIPKQKWRSSKNCAKIAPTASKRRQHSNAFKY
jgi:hypothetical protein